jgi:RNA polymerase sigma-70 factor (ECF subfamily)
VKDDVRGLYETHGRALLAYACALLRNPSAAEDVLHQVFVNLLRARKDITGEPGPYLFRAVRYGALNHLRGQAREVELADGGVWLESPDGSTETSMALQSALRTLPEEQREVVVLKIWGELTFEEAAAVIGISPNTAASRYRYGLEKLKDIWKSEVRSEK